MKMRKYLAWIDTGTDFVHFEFESSHRAGSRANHEDARIAYRRRHGRRIRVITTTLIE